MSEGTEAKIRRENGKTTARISELDPRISESASLASMQTIQRTQELPRFKFLTGK